MAAQLVQVKPWIVIYCTVYKVNSMIKFWSVTAGYRISVNHPNKPIKNELLQLTNLPHNNKNNNWVNTWFSVTLNSKVLIWLCLSGCSHFYSLTLAINLQLINTVWLTADDGIAVILWHVVTGVYMSSTVGSTSSYIYFIWHKLY